MFSFSLFAEIEAKEACDWLRAAGFPQYVQLFKGKYEAVIPRHSTHSVTSKWVQMMRRAASYCFICLVCVSDCRFPVDIEWAKRDHSFLDQDALDSMCR